MDKSEFEIDKTIDPNQLDIEAAQQAEIFFKWAERAVEAKALMEQKKFNFDVLEAEIGAKIRRAPKEFGVMKETENAINTAVKTHPEFIRAYQEYLNAREDMLMLDQAVAALEQKKRMIEVLITLHGQQYFAGPSVPRNLTQAWADHQNKRNERINDRQKKLARRKD